MRILLSLLLVCSLVPGQNAQKQLLLADTDAPVTPVDSPGGGTYSSTQSVTITDATATFILYTLDGSTPACPGTGTLYTGAFNISTTTTLKAIGCNGITGGGVLTSVYTITAGVVYVSSTFNTTEVGATPCPSAVCTFTGVVFSNTGDTVFIAPMVICLSSGCAQEAPVSVTFSASDGTNTYTAIPGATVISSSNPAIAGSYLNQGVLYAKNVTAGTYSIAVTISASNNVYFPVLGVIEVSGANISTPLDTNVTASGTATSASPSLTSPGNVSASNEMAIAFLASASADSFSWGGSFTQKTSYTHGGGIFVTLAIDTNPTSGAKVTASGSQTSGAYQMSLVAAKP
jgi:Chitobiase/beta-hexosaminidase C-terminal domain